MVTVVFPTPPRRLDTAMKVVTEGFPKIIPSTGSPLPNRRLCLSRNDQYLYSCAPRRVRWTALMGLLRHHRRAARSRPHNHCIENNGKTTTPAQDRHGCNQLSPHSVRGTADLLKGLVGSRAA